MKKKAFNILMILQLIVIPLIVFSLFSYLVPFGYLIGVFFLGMLILNLLIFLTIKLFIRFFFNELSKLLILILSFILISFINFYILPAGLNKSPYNEAKNAYISLINYDDLNFNNIFEVQFSNNRDYEIIAARYKYEKELPKKIYNIEYAHPCSCSSYIINKGGEINRSFSIYFKDGIVNSNKPRLDIKKLNEDTILINDFYLNTKIRFLIDKSNNIKIIDPKTIEKKYISDTWYVARCENIEININTELFQEPIQFQKLFKLILKIIHKANSRQQKYKPY
jgi:hypothetical protein